MKLSTENHTRQPDVLPDVPPGNGNLQRVSMIRSQQISIARSGALVFARPEDRAWAVEGRPVAGILSVAANFQGGLGPFFGSVAAGF